MTLSAIVHRRLTGKMAVNGPRAGQLVDYSGEVKADAQIDSQQTPPGRYMTGLTTLFLIQE